jgi:hypothetical protein
MPDPENRYEMLWDCPGCSTPKLLGITHRHCPNCGAPQDATKRYFPPAGEEVAVENHPFQGKDKVCAGCDTPNAARAVFCTGCGGPLDGSKEAATRKEQVAGSAGFAADSAKEATRERAAAKQAAEAESSARHAAASGVAVPEKSGGGSGKFLLIGGGGLLLLGLAAVCALFLFWKQEAAVVVTGHRWERTIDVETLTPTSGSNWQDSVPAGAYNLQCAQAEKEKKQVADGETCVDKRVDKGDGSFSVQKECTPKYREEPVYGMKCSYTVNSWAVTATQKAAGASLTPAPSWPTVALMVTGNSIGAQREGARKESYTVDFVDDSKKALSCTLPEAKWASLADGSRWKAQVGVMSGALDCSALQPG